MRHTGDDAEIAIGREHFFPRQFEHRLVEHIRRVTIERMDEIEHGHRGTKLEIEPHGVFQSRRYFYICLFNGIDGVA